VTRTTGSSRVTIVVTVALLAAAAAYVQLNPPARLVLESGTLAALPANLGGFRSTELEFEDVVYEELKADDTLVRRYSSPEGETIWFVIIFHQNDRYGAHDPVVCYRSQGWEIVESGLVPVARKDGGFNANWLLLESAGTRRVAVYWWYTAGELATADRDRFLSRMAVSGIATNVTFGAFVRASTVVRGGDVEGALDLLGRFVQETLPYLPDLFGLENTGG